MQWWINFPFFRPSSLYLKCYSQWSSVNKIKKFFSKTHLGNIVFHFTLDFCLTVKIIMQASFIIHTAAKFQSWKFTKWLLPWVQIYQHNCSNLMYQIMFIVLKLHACPSFLTAKLNSRSRILLIHSVIFHHIREIFCQKVFYFTCSNYHE